MSADMQKARAAIVLLREAQSCGMLGDEHIGAIADLADAFEWLDETKQLLAIEHKAAVYDLDIERGRVRDLARQLSNGEQVGK